MRIVIDVNDSDDVTNVPAETKKITETSKNDESVTKGDEFEKCVVHLFDMCSPECFDFI